MSISVSASDEEGTVSEVRLFLDEIGIAELEFPYNYQLNTDEYNSGEYTLKVTARDNEGLESSDEVKIIIDAAFSTITTSKASNITFISAQVGGNVSEDGGGEITETGVYWDTIPSPETKGYKISMSEGLGEFTGTISELPHGKIIYYKAYSINSAGKATGEERFFETTTVPSVLTSSASSINHSSATVGGEFTADGGEAVTEVGIYWSNESMTGGGGARLVIENDESTFATTLTELSAFTTYYYKAFALNAAGESLGEELSFTTTGTATVNTLPVVSIRYTQVLIGGEVTDDGGYPLSETGFYWGYSPDPVNTGTRISIGSQLGSFSHTMTDVNPVSTIHIIAFAVTSAGESVGEEVLFELEAPAVGSFVDSRDGEEYGTVTIGDQVWMSENLKATLFNDGTVIPHFDDPAEWSANSGPAYSWYNNDENESERGALYNWYTLDTKKLCPSGWHVPDEPEWQELEVYLGMDAEVSRTDDFRGTNEGGMLKSTTLWENPNTGATDELGFSAIPTGRKGEDGLFLYRNQMTLFLTSGLGPGNVPYRRYFSYEEGRISRSTVRKGYAYPVRCVKDK